MATYPLHITDVPYSTESRLNTLDICLPRPLEESPKNAHWVVYVDNPAPPSLPRTRHKHHPNIEPLTCQLCADALFTTSRYIHGGAWRDPLITASSIRPTIDHLLKTNSPALAQIAGFASIHYRLSPYPNHPTHPTRLDPKSTEARIEGRSVAHPTHQEDVLQALAWLRDAYNLADPDRQSGAWSYVLVGHSCGATLALQAAIKLKLPPVAVAGIAGIYDIPTFAQNHVDVPVYGEILAGAFGGGPIDQSMKKRWEEASPAHAVKQHDSGWGLRRLVLAQSRADELVEWEQTELMRGQAQKSFPVQVLEIGGHHDQCWQDGDGVAQTIEALLTGLS